MKFALATLEPSSRDPFGPAWMLPSGANSVILLSPEASKDAPIGLCTFADDSKIPDGAVDFGIGARLSDCFVSAKQRDGWLSLLNTKPSSRPTLDGLLHDTLTQDADPTGAANARPMPLIATGIAPYYLNSALVSSFPLTLADPSAVALLKQCQAEIYQRVLDGKEPPGIHRQWIATKLDMLGLTAADVALISSSKVPPSERIPLKPSTTLTDDFSSGNLNNWTAVNGSWSNVASDAELGTGGTHCGMYHNTALSGSDHYAQCDWSKGDHYAYYAFGPRIRMSSSGDGFAWYSYTGGGGNPNIVKLSGTNYSSTVGQGSDGITDSPHTLKLDIVGSTLRGYWDGTLKVTATDTSYPSNLKVGFHGYGGGGVDNFSASDGILDPPTVSTVSANSGPAAGGTNVTITGTGFVATPTVTFGGTSATNVVLVNSTTITCTTPAHAAGAVNVVVTNPDTQTGTGTNAFTYVAAPTVSSVSANSGPAAGGTNVTVTGTGFSATPTITFGGSAATNVAFTNSTTLTCTTPAHAAGAVDVVVTNPDTQTGTGTGVFTYIAPAAATSSNCSITSGCGLGMGLGV